MLYYISFILFLYFDFICKYVNFCSDFFFLESVRFFKRLMIVVIENYLGEINVFIEKGIYIYVIM